MVKPRNRNRKPKQPHTILNSIRNPQRAVPGHSIHGKPILTQSGPLRGAWSTLLDSSTVPKRVEASVVFAQAAS